MTSSDQNNDSRNDEEACAPRRQEQKPKETKFQLNIVWLMCGLTVGAFLMVGLVGALLRSANVKLNATSAPSMFPSASPSTAPSAFPSTAPTVPPLPSASPSSAPSEAVVPRLQELQDSTEGLEFCGTEPYSLWLGLDQVSQAFDNVEDALAGYAQLLPVYPNTVHFHYVPDREEYDIDAMYTASQSMLEGVNSFVDAFVQNSNKTSDVSSLAAFTKAASYWLTDEGPAGQFPPSPWNEIDDADEINRSIIGKLEQVGNLKKFQSLSYSARDTSEWEQIPTSFRNSETMAGWKWATHLLRDSYEELLDPDMSPEERKFRVKVFYETCWGWNTPDLKDPYLSFASMYTHACSECDLFYGFGYSSNLLDTFVEMAQEEIDGSILWFRRTFGTYILSSMIQAFYMHSACVYLPAEPAEGCFAKIDWLPDLEEMGAGIKEVAANLVRAEYRFECLEQQKLDPDIICD